MLWDLYRTASSTGRRPSEILGVTDPWHAPDLDNGVARFGSHVESQMDRAEWEYRDEQSDGGIVDPDVVRDRRETAWYLWVRAQVRRFRYYWSGGDNDARAGRRYALVKPATWTDADKSDRGCEKIDLLE